MIVARQSTARTVTVGPVLDADGVAVTDGVVGDLKLSKNGGAPAALNGSATLTHRHTGHYSLALTASDLDTVGSAEVVMDDTVNAMQPKELTIIEEAVYDALYAASAPGYVANAPVNVEQWNATNVPAEHTAGYPVVTVKVGRGTGELYTAHGFTNVLADGTSDSITTSTVVDAARTEATGDWWKGGMFIPVEGENALQPRLITAFDAGTDTLTFTPTLGAEPVDQTVTYVVLPWCGVDARLHLGTAYAAPQTGGIPKVNAVEWRNQTIPATSQTGVPVVDLGYSLGVAVTNSDGTAQAGGASTVTLAAGASAVNDFYKDSVVRLVAGTGAGQSRVVTGYVGATKVATVHEAWATNPDSTSEYVFEGNADVNVQRVSEDATAADNAEAFFDGTGYAGTNNVIPTVTTLTNLPAVTANWLTAAGLAADAGAEIAAAVWDLATSGHTTSGSFGEAMNAAGSAGDPWTTTLPGSYTSGQAGYIVGTNLNATVTSRMATYTQPTGFLAATFPATVASTTNITGGTITTVTTLTNLPAVTTDWLTAAGVSAAAVTKIQSGLSTVTTAQVNAEVLDVLNVDTFAELAADPGASPTVVKALMLLYMALRNKVDVTATAKEVHNNAGTVLLTKTLSDDGTTYSETKMA